MAASAQVVEGAAAHLEYAKWICETKVPFATKGKARAVAVERLAHDPTLKALWAYRCTACRTWHLTKRKRGKPLAERRKTPNVSITGRQTAPGC